MERHNNSTSTVILPFAILAAVLFCIAAVLLLTIKGIWFVSVKCKAYFQPQAATAVVYPEQVIAAVFEEEEIGTQLLNKVEERVETVQNTVVEVQQDKADVEEIQDDETLIPADTIGMDEALRLLSDVNRTGWHTMLRAIGEKQQISIPSNFKQMTKNKTRASALLRLRVSASVATKAREIALQQSS